MLPRMKNVRVLALGTSEVLQDGSLPQLKESCWKQRAERSHGILARWKILVSSISLFKYLFNPTVKEY